MAKLGIDFGTTNSLAVAYDKTKGEFIYFNKVRGKAVPTSSTIYFHDNEVVVGNEAREKMYKFADVDGYHFERSIKLKLGYGKTINVFGKKKDPVEIASLIIQSLKQKALDLGAQKANIEIDNAVFTVPINFTGKQREDLRKSAHKAGIEITSFIHEPFAAIVGYYFSKEEGNYKKVLNKLDALNGNNLLIFDWGGGTLDITVVKVNNGKMIELGTAELTGVAGDKFDEDLATYVWNKFKDKYSHKYSEEYLDKIKKDKWGTLLATAERCKIALSEQEHTIFEVDFITKDEDISEVITRKDFEKLIERTLLLASNKIRDALSIAGIDAIDIQHVLLTGGTCYIPAVQEMMIKEYGHRVENVKDADLLIAQGAAVISEMGWLPFLTKDIMIQLSDNSYWPIFEYGLPIGAGVPAKNYEEFICTDSRNKKAKIIVCEGLNQISDKMLTVLNVPILGDERFGDEIHVEAIINENIVLIVRSHSKMVKGYKQPDEEYSERITKEVNQLCFGLDFRG